MGEVILLEEEEVRKGREEKIIETEAQEEGVPDIGRGLHSNIQYLSIPQWALYPYMFLNTLVAHSA